MKRFLLGLPIVLGMLFMVSCSGCNNGSSRQGEGDGATDSVCAAGEASCGADAQACCARFAGEYTATLPAADGPGILSKLTILPKGQFKLSEEYLESDPVSKFDYEGSFTCNKELKYLTLTPTNGEVRYLLVEEDHFILLSADEVAKLPEYTRTELTDAYTFRRVEAAAQPAVQ